MAVDPGPPHWHEPDHSGPMNGPVPADEHQASHQRMGPHVEYEAKESMRLGAWASEPQNSVGPHDFARRHARFSLWGWLIGVCTHCYYAKSAHPIMHWTKARPMNDNRHPGQVLLNGDIP
jgi:hypothetical protein